MIVLDTNVLSAAMRRDIDPTVIDWLDAQPPLSVWTTSVNVFEIRLGIEILPTGRKRRMLEEAFSRAITEDFGDRILPFDRLAADAAALIASSQRKAGRIVEIRDVQIAGIAAARKATLATRNVRHFEGAGIHLINPWSH